MILTKEEVEHIAQLARLRLNDEEKAVYSRQLSAILGYVNKMSEADTAKVAPTSQVTGLTNVMREDQIEASSVADGLINCAPAHDDGYIKIPKIFEDKN